MPQDGVMQSRLSAKQRRMLRRQKFQKPLIYKALCQP